MRYTVFPAAVRDLDEHAMYLGERAGIETALRFYDSASHTFAMLTESPGIGEPRPSSRPELTGLRVCSIEGFTRHLVFYRVEGDTIEVIRVLHGRRDLGVIVPPAEED